MEQAQKGIDKAADTRPTAVYQFAIAMACLLLASAGICWVAANWASASVFSKLAGAQLVLVALVVVAWFMPPNGSALRNKHERAKYNFTARAHLIGLAGVATGALLALIGQIYQTGADAWQLFLTWALLLIPWLLTQHTLFIGLLFATVLNTAFALYVGTHNGAVWYGWGSWVSSALLAAILNAAMLLAWETFSARFGDQARIGPRVLATAVAGWLIAAAFMGIDTSAGPIGMAIVGWVALAIMYVGYTRWRSDLAIVSLAVLSAFILLVLPLLYWVGSEIGLLLVVLVLLAAMAFGLRKLSGLLRARDVRGEPWYIGAFRLVAMGITAVLLVVFLLLVLDFDVEFLWAPGVVLCLAGMLVYRKAGADALRELGLTIMTTGLLLCGGSFFALHEQGASSVVYAWLVLGVGLYVLAGNAAFRFVTAFIVLGMTTILTWPEGVDTLFQTGHAVQDGFLSVYLRTWWFSLGGALALLVGQGEGAGRRWRPLGWALVFLAQIIVWFAPAPQLDSVLSIWHNQPSLIVIWLACAALPVVALAGLLWRAPALSAVLRWGAPFALAVAAVGWIGAPGVSLALLWLILGKTLKHRSLMAFGVLALLAYLMRYYYQLDTSLLHKSFVLGATGAWLLASAWMLKQGSGSVGVLRASGHIPAAQNTEQNTQASANSTVTPPSTVHITGTSRFSWKPIGLITGLLLVLIVANTGIYQRQSILADGQRVVLELAPVDPRSLMQGDYMQLDYSVANQVDTALKQAPEPVRLAIKARQAGLLVLRPDKAGVHRLHTVVPLKAGSGLNLFGVGPEPDATDSGLDENDILLQFRMRDGHVRIVTNAWFFPEGQGDHFAQARYGEFRVDASGAGLLINMLDQALQPLAQR